MKARYIFFIAFSLILLTSLVPAQETGSFNSQDYCGELMFFSMETCPHCDIVKPEFDKFVENPGCVKVTEQDISDFGDMDKDPLFLKYDITAVPTFVFIDNEGCYETIAIGSTTKYEDLVEGIDDFKCEEPPTPDYCGELIFFSLDTCPYCDQVRPEFDKFVENSGCVEVKEYAISDLRDITDDERFLEYGIKGVPAFVFIDEDECSGKIAEGGNTKYEDIVDGIEDFKCGSDPYIPPIDSIDCLEYKICEDNTRAYCRAVDNKCLCESCSADIPDKPIDCPEYKKCGDGSITGCSVIDNKCSCESCSADIPDEPECYGCSLDENCYPFGYRKNGNFCSDINNNFIVQKNAEASCENNFECSTNLCVDNQCVSSGLWKRMVNWFGRLFR